MASEIKHLIATFVIAVLWSIFLFRRVFRASKNVANRSVAYMDTLDVLADPKPVSLHLNQTTPAAKG